MMEEVIEEGPWLFQGQPVVLQPWEQGMSLRRHKHTRVTVWIRLRHLLMEYWTEDGLSVVASGVGVLLYADRITKSCLRLDFARFIHCEITNKSAHTKCLMTVVYGECDLGRRRGLWSGLCELAEANSEVPWCVLGDFNAIVDTSEACGRAVDVGPSMTDFRDCIRIAALVYLPFTGCPFTWHNCSEGSRSLWKRLDRVLVNDAWLVKWPQASYVCALPVHNVWRHSIYGTKMFGVVTKLKALKSTFRAQRKAKGDLANNVQRSKDFLDLAQSLFAEFNEDILLNLVQWCRTVYCAAVKMEVSMLQQRAKMSWLKHGDQCSQLFFRKVNTRRVRQRIYQITIVAGDSVTEPSQVAEEFVAYYHMLLGGTRVRRRLDLPFLQPVLRCTISQADANELIAEVTDAEIKGALFDISEDSAPGPDGYSSAFFKSAWSEIGGHVCDAVREFFHSGRILKQINSTLLVLIPKMQLPTRVSDFRPIACCNVLYKVITKVLICRLQRVLYMLIDPAQTAFVPGRSISDNVLLAQELLAGYNRARLPARCTIKVDFQKAYDTNDADFLYYWKCREVGLINLCFADDVLVFCAGTSYSVQTISTALAEFAELSGLRANPNKSLIILSRAVREERQAILEIISFPEGTLPIKYLGVPLVDSRLKIADCRGLLEKIDDRLAGWGHLHFSFAGRVQLIKSVLSSLHTYWASVFFLPKAIITEIERRMRQFLWKGAAGRGYAKGAWHRVCAPMREGGLGICQVGHLNQALMLKQIWRILQRDEQSVWKLCPGEFSTAGAVALLRPSSPSVPWQHLLGGKFKIPRHAFVLWLAVLKRLSTLDRPWVNQQPWCVLCDGVHIETHDHLFFKCSYSARCISLLKRSVRFTWLGLGWQRDMLWACRRWRGSHLLNAAARAMLASMVYSIWRERNNRIFLGTAMSAETVTRQAIEEIRRRIVSAELRPSLQLFIVYRVWKIPWLMVGYFFV
ncbi:UNVERIFIED_CONTAM: hypothetical protein Sradi_4001100 [Sesamum radiatum]|uniref:Reverse transcriptase domain-containing protein n=1 Tax=Sesamum radiatum TaxID=300843 RepID=A0AAW2PKC4_SESRA